MKTTIRRILFDISLFLAHEELFSYRHFVEHRIYICNIPVKTTYVNR